MTRDSGWMLSYRSLLALLLLVASAVFLANLGHPLGLHQNDEDFYFDVAREMFTSGQAWVPTWHGQVAFQKPPALYWLMMACMSVLGPSLLAGRLPVALCSIALALATAGFGRRLFSSRAGLVAGFVVVTSVGMFQYGRVAMMDVPLALLWMGTAWGFWAFGQGRVGPLYLGFAAMGVATLLKGPVGAVIPVLAGVLWAAGGRVSGQAAGLPRRWAWHVLGAALVAVLVFGFWPAVLYLYGWGPEWVDRFIRAENMGKFEGGQDSVLKMLAGFAALLLPWTLLLLAGLGGALKRVRDGRVTLLLAFCVSTVAVYSLPHVKWPQYLLPCLPFLALLLGLSVEGARTGETWAGEEPQGSGVGLGLRLAAGFTGAALVGAAGVVALGIHVFPGTLERVLLGVVAVGLGVCGMALLNGPRLVTASLALAPVLVSMAFVAPFLTMQRLPAELGEVTGNREMMTYAVPPYYLSLQLGRPVGVTDQPERFREAFEAGTLMVVGQSEIQELVARRFLDMRRARMLACWRKWRKGLRMSDVLRTLLGGSLDDLTENVCILERTKPR